MKFTMNGKTYELDENKIIFAEGEAVEKVTGMSITEVGRSIIAGYLKPQRAMAWIAVKRTEPSLKFEDTAHWNIGDIEWSYEVDEEEDKDKDKPEGESDIKKGEPEVSPLSENKPESI